MHPAFRFLVASLLAFCSLACSPPQAAKPQSGAPPIESIQPGEGYVQVTGGKVWYRIVGSGKGTPLLLLHGGPGGPSDYLEPLEALRDERPVVIYDQLGCGKSDRPDDPKLWRIERFVEELAKVREALGVKHVQLFGHSWGTMLAVDYLLTKPEGVEGLVLASPCISAPRWIEDQNRYRRDLPNEVQEVLDRNEKAGTTDSKEYEQATIEFYKRHLCRAEPLPEAMLKSRSGFGEPVYLAMWGPSEFYATGNLKDYDRTGRLGEIAAPTLFTCGAYDEAAPATVKYYQSLLPGSELVIFEKSGHMAHLEETDAYLQTVGAFLRRVDEGRAKPTGIR